jgi:MFS family permease
LAICGGLGASLLLPAMQSLIHGNYALVGAAATIAAAVGPLLGGFITTFLLLGQPFITRAPTEATTSPEPMSPNVGPHRNLELADATLLREIGFACPFLTRHLIHPLGFLVVQFHRAACRLHRDLN